MSLLENKFIDEQYFMSEYNTAFRTEFVSLQPQEKDRFFKLASTRVRRLIDKPFIDLNDLEQEQQEGVKIASSQLLDYWLEYGLDLNRISGSVSLGTFSATQTAPNDPDYIPEMVYETLMSVNLYTPAGYLSGCEIEHIDQEQAITYGVRFKGLERVKDITIEKTISQANNKDLHIPTTATMNQAIALAASNLGTKHGTYQTDDISNIIDPTNATAYLNGNIPTAVDGDTAQLKLVDDTSSYDGLVELFEFDGTDWVRITDNFEQRLITAQLAGEVEIVKNNQISLNDTDAKYIAQSKALGTTTMGATYWPTQNKDVSTKDYVDGADQLIATRLTYDENRIATLENATALEDKVWDGAIELDDTNDLSTLVDKQGLAFDFTDDKQILLFIREKGANGASANIIVGNTTPQSFVIPEGNGTSETIASTLANTGILSNSIANGSNSLDEYELVKIIETKAQVANSAYATTQDLTNEINSRTAADAGLQTSITTNGSAITALDMKVDGIDGEVDILQVKTTGMTYDQPTNTTNFTSTITMNGAEVATDADLSAAIATITDVNAEVKYYEGQEIAFNVEKTGTKFEDATLFDKATRTIITGGNAPVSITDKTIEAPLGGTHTTGGVDYDYKLITVPTSGTGITSPTIKGETEASGGFIKDPWTDPVAKVAITGLTGSTDLSQATKITQYVYTAKKDITFAEMK